MPEVDDEDAAVMARAIQMARSMYRPETGHAMLRATLHSHFGLTRHQIDDVIETLRRDREPDELG